MKSVVIIGMGKFGHHLCKDLIKRGNEVMIVDIKEDIMEDMVPYVTCAHVGDCTNEEVLRTIGIRNFDIVFVCIGANFQNSLEITNLCKELGAKYVISKANRDVHAKFLLKNGADEVVYPDKDIAQKLAVRCSADHVFDYIELDDENSIYEIPPLKEWVGKTIKDANVRAKYGVNIIGIKRHDKARILPPPDYVFKENQHLMVLGSKENVTEILKHIK